MYEKNSNQYNLKREIEQLEAEQSLKEKLLREQFYLTYESLKPVNLLMNTVKDFISMPLVVEKSISTIAGFFAGYISKKMKVDTNTSIFGENDCSNCEVWSVKYYCKKPKYT
jgi:hypothetical protein